MNEEEKYSQIQFHLNDYHLLNIKSVIKKVKYDIKYTINITLCFFFAGVVCFILDYNFIEGLGFNPILHSIF